jgi:molecular chaperone DnaK
LKRCALTNQDVARIVFVGGPTQYKPLRDYVSEQLGIEADLQVDPMMAVAEGAAIFAESIDWNSSKNPPKPMRRTAAASAELQLSFDFAARTPGDRTQIIAKCDDASLDGHQFQIESLDSGWSSGRMKLRSGASCAVRLPRMGANTFLVSLFTRNGAPVSGTESRLTITRVAAVVESIPASHSIGVEGKLSLHGNVTKLFFLVRKGDPLPKKGQEIFKAAEKLSAGDPAALIFKLYEGEIESPVTDNRFVGSLKITGADFESGKIRPGDDLVCEYEVAQSGRLSLVVSVPSIGSSFPSDDLRKPRS